MDSLRLGSLTALTIAALASATPVAAEETPPQITVEATIARDGDFMAFAFGSLWMMSERKLARINPIDNSVVDIPVNGTIGGYRGVAAGEGAIWVPDVGSDTIYKVDPQKNEVALTIPIDLRGSEGTIGIGEGSVWAVAEADYNRTLIRYNADTGAEQATIHLPSPSTGVIVDFGSVWITGTNNGELYRVDPKANRVTATIALRSRPRFLASGEGSVWVLNQGDGTVQRIDGKTGEFLATIEAGGGGSGGDIAIGGGYVWVTTTSLPVIQIDPKTNALLGKFKRPSGLLLGDAIRYGAGSLWVSGSSVFRIKPPE